MPQPNLEDVFKASLPFWGNLSENEKRGVLDGAMLRKYGAKTILSNMTDESSPGIQIVKQGRARVFINSRDGKQLTLQRILENELSVIGVSCVLDNVIFNVSLETETACEVALIPRVICKQLFSKNIAVKDSVIDMITVKFSQTMRILETVTFSSMGSRLANALIEQSSFAGSEIFTVTHESIAADLGTAREVVTRLLNQFQTDGLVKLLRGKIEINNMQALAAMRGEALRDVSKLLYPKYY